jgi:hypothetical protein
LWATEGPMYRDSVCTEPSTCACGDGQTGQVDYVADATHEASFPGRNPEPGPVQPSDEVRKELQAYLAADSSRVGEVYRLLEEGLAADAIAERLEGGAAGAWQYRRMVRALLDGNLPTAPTIALAAARRYRTALKASALSTDARAYLQANLDELERRANDPARLDEEVQRASAQTQQAEARNEAGVYVYALPHYIRHPYDQASDRTLLKVGRSDSDVIVRFRSQIRTTALPEEPILLRIYRTSGASTAPAEAAFHRLLDAADHSRTAGKSAGREWFLTHTRFLDEIARTLGLHIDMINEGEFDNH